MSKKSLKISKRFLRHGEKRHLETFDDESSEQQIVNLYLIEKEEEFNQVFYESNSFDKLQNALDDLHEESNKKGLKNSMFKKLFASLNLEIDELKLHASKLKNKNDCLNAKVLDLI